MALMKLTARAPAGIRIEPLAHVGNTALLGLRPLSLREGPWLRQVRLARGKPPASGGRYTYKHS
jgi:hypothetical protein